MHDNKQIVRDFLNASQIGDHETMAILLHPDAEIREADSLPYAGVYHGLEGFLNLVKTVFTSFRDTKVKIEDIIGEGDMVIVLASLSGYSKHSDERFRMPVAEVWRVVDSRIRSITPYYFDTARLSTLAVTV